MRRAIPALAVAGALCVALTGCHGPISTHTTTIVTDCTLSFGGTSTNGTATLNVSVDSSSFATPGAKVTFSNLTMDGEPAVPAEYPIAVFVTATGLAPFLNPPALPPAVQALVPAGAEFMGGGSDASTAFVAPDGTHVQGSHITGGAGSTATLDLSVVVIVGQDPTKDLGVCTPQAGQSARLASISIVDGGGH